MSRLITLEDARIIFRNFSGKEGQYNREGDRNFAVVLEPSKADELQDMGWNVKFLKPNEGYEEDEPTAYIPVSVSYKHRAPKIVLVSSNAQTILDEEAVDILDSVDIRTVDLILTPYHWSVNGKSGIKAYLKTMYVVINEDELELKYAQV